ncbi:MAG: phosphoadenylyl-sulfate reductase [Rhodoferax sp.]|nr:phosphoadenylyl-sulfate reductase [Rhodoferax sp.]
MNAVTRNQDRSDTFGDKLSEAQLVLQSAAALHPTARVQGPTTPTLVQASGLGAEDMVISHLINTLQLDIGIFVLDTGRLHEETLALLDRFQRSSRAPVTVYSPNQDAVLEFVTSKGLDSIYQSMTLRKTCCAIRKLEPLERALAGKDAWITGLRREQSVARADVPLIDHSQARIKFNPLAHWTWGDIWHYLGANQVDYNPLHDQFFPSIGCAPCTRAISQGEDFRSGRWWWEADQDGGAVKECGLHVKTATSTQSDLAEIHAASMNITGDL